MNHKVATHSDFTKTQLENAIGKRLVIGVTNHKVATHSDFTKPQLENAVSSLSDVSKTF